MRLNDLNSCFDNVAPSSEQKQRMLDKILERKTENGGTESLKHGTKRLAIAVALVAVFVLMATTALAVGFGWHERFIEYFGIGEDQNTLLDGAVGSPGISITENGVTVEVLQTLADSQGVYVIFEVTVPDDVELTNDTGFEWAMLNAETEQRTEGISMAVSGAEVLDISGKKLIAIASYIPNDPIKSGTLRLSLNNLGYNIWTEGSAGVPEHEYYSFVEGKWVLEWEFTYEDTAKKVTPNQIVDTDGSSLVTAVSISPVSICVSAEGPLDSSLEALLVGGEITVTFIDGNMISYSSVDRTSSFGRSLAKENDLIYNYQMYNRFDRIIDPDDVVSVTLCDVTIPIR